MNDSTAAGRPYLCNTTSNNRLRGIAWCGLVLLALLGLGGCNEPEATPTPAPTAVAALPAAAPPAGASSTPTLTQTLTQTLTPAPVESEATGTATATTTATATDCPAPEGWVVYSVALGDTLSRLGAASGASVAELMQANCLADDAIYEGQALHLPAAPPPTSMPTPEPTRCGAPAGWVIYVVQAGDTLSGLAAAVGAAVDEIRLANCLPDDTIYAGHGLRLPRLSGGAGVAAAGAAPVTVAESPTRRLPTPTCVGFACASAQEVQDPSIDFGPGSPAGGDLCSDIGSEVKISIGWQDAFGQIVVPTSTPLAGAPDSFVVGSKLVFGACNVDGVGSVSFTLAEQGGAPAPLPTTLLSAAGTPVAVAAWQTNCDEAGRQYKISFATNSSAISGEQVFVLKTPRFASSFFERLPGNQYRANFCYETPQTKTINLRLYHGKLEGSQCRVTTYRDAGTLAMSPAATSGSYVQELPLPGDTGNCYVLRDMSTPSKPTVVILFPGP